MEVLSLPGGAAWVPPLILPVRNRFKKGATAGKYKRCGGIVTDSGDFLATVVREGCRIVCADVHWRPWYSRSPKQARNEVLCTKPDYS